jgi:Spy/CpxP family protein refolding chaperone
MKNWSKMIASVMMLLVGASVFGQEDKSLSKEEKKEHFEKIEAAKREFFQQELKLTEKEAEKFWTVYDAYKKEEKSNKHQKHDVVRELQSKFDSLPEKDVKAKTESIFSFESKEIDIRKKYLNNAAAVIGYKRAAQSLYLEHEFRQKLRERIDERGPDGAMPPRGKHRTPPPVKEN